MKRIRPLFEAMSRGAVIGLIGLAVAGAALAWTGPSGSPPNNNTPAPINVSSTAQTKSGALDIMGNVGIGTTSPAGNLDVNGSLCISGSCITSWVAASPAVFGGMFRLLYGSTCSTYTNPFTGSCSCPGWAPYSHVWTSGILDASNYWEAFYFCSNR
ncbi:MAG: hypothetical protein KGH79_03940 [Patescibacteria group bacterium]|nr:hypothetical protein [Patescibacteria group bacterium]